VSLRSARGAVLAGRPSVQNQGRLVVGARLRLDSVPVQSHLVVAPGGLLELGDDVSIGHGAAIAAHAHVRISDGARIGPFVSIADTDFHVAGQREARPERTPIWLGRGVRLAARVTVLRGAVIGDGVRVLAGSVVAGVVQAGATVGGVPARVIGARARGGAAEPAEEVPRIVAEVLALPGPPGPGQGPSELEGWDSLGALRLLLALEERFEVTLDESAMPRARSVADLTELVEAALARAAERPSGAGGILAVIGG
jgi:acetyltransferase-like isoleucine patch superfamily enzyme/acyl carrier protein